MRKAIRAYEKTRQVKILLNIRVEKLLTDEDDNNSVIGVECQQQTDADDQLVDTPATNVELATGGFAADRTRDSLLSKYRPELMNMAATAGHFSTGDGVMFATALGAGTTDMEKVQIHPTGWVDPADPDNPNRVLATEILRIAV